MNPAGPWFVCRPRIVRYCCLSWEMDADASRNTVLRNGDKRRSHPRVLALTEARRRLLTPRTNMRPKGNRFQRPQVRHGTNPRSSSPVMMRSLTWPYPQKSPYSFDTAPAAAHRPRRVNTHSTKLQLLAHVHKRQKIPRSLLVCRHQNSTTRHHPARRRRSRPQPRTTSGAAAAGYREVLRRLVASAGVIHVPRLWWVE